MQDWGGIFIYKVRSCRYILKYIWAGYPIRLRLQEDDKKIVLKRTVKNSCLHTLLSAICAAFYIFIFILCMYFTRNMIFRIISFFWTVPGLFMAVDIICIWTYRIEINKQTQNLTVRWHLIKMSYVLGGGLWLAMPGEGITSKWLTPGKPGAAVYYDNRLLFVLPYHSEAYHRVVEYFKEVDVLIDWPC